MVMSDVMFAFPCVHYAASSLQISFDQQFYPRLRCSHAEERQFTYLPTRLPLKRLKQSTLTFWDPQIRFSSLPQGTDPTLGV